GIGRNAGDHRAVGVGVGAREAGRAVWRVDGDGERAAGAGGDEDVQRGPDVVADGRAVECAEHDARGAGEVRAGDGDGVAAGGAAGGGRDGGDGGGNDRGDGELVVGAGGAAATSRGHDDVVDLPVLERCRDRDGDLRRVRERSDGDAGNRGCAAEGHGGVIGEVRPVDRQG